LCLPGSLRRVSANTAALRAVRELTPAELSLALHAGTGSLPWFNPDDENTQLPHSVQALRTGRATATRC